MAGYVIHLAIAQEYIKKHKENNENWNEFMYGVIQPDLIQPKSKTHYGKSPAYTNLKNFLDNNSIDNSINRGKFLHLITDYLFYNFYLENISKNIYNDYDILNKRLINKYNVKIPQIVRNNVFFKKGKTEILNINLANQIINEISDLDIENVKNEIYENNIRWHTYKNLV